jgi:hypothetical protein
MNKTLTLKFLTSCVPFDGIFRCSSVKGLNKSACILKWNEDPKLFAEIDFWLRTLPKCSYKNIEEAR